MGGSSILDNMFTADAIKPQQVNGATVAALVSLFAGGVTAAAQTLTQTDPVADTFGLAGAAIDGNTFNTVGQRLLVKNEALPQNDGVYEVTQVGDGTAPNPWILTRTKDANTPAALANPATFLVTGGVVNENMMFTQTATGVIVVGTTPLEWTIMASASRLLYSAPTATVIAAAFVDCTVTGAVMGDPCWGEIELDDGTPLTGILTAIVSAPDTVRVTFAPVATTVNGRVRAFVLRPNPN